MRPTISDSVGRALERWTGLVRRLRVPLLVLAGLATLGSVWLAASRLGISTDTESLFSASLPWRTAMDRYEEAFPHAGHTLLVVIDGPTAGAAARMQDRLSRRLERADTLFASVYAPGAGEYFERHGLLFRTPDELRSLASRLEAYGGMLGRLEREPTLPTLAAVLDSTLEANEGRDGLDLRPVFGLLGQAFSPHERQPVAWSRLFRAERSTGDDRRRFVVLRPHRDHALVSSGEQSIRAVRRAVEELGLESRPGTDVRLTGRIAMRYEELRSASRGALLAGVLALLLVAIVLHFGLGAWRLIFAALATLAVGLAGTAAWAAVVVGYLNLLSVAFAVLYIGLGVDYAVHLALRYRELRGAGRPHADSLEEAVRDVGPSLLLSAVTTALVFFSFTLTDFVGLSELGVISGGGMFVSLAVTLTVFPALVDLLPLPRRAATGRDEVTRALDSVAAGAERHGRKLLWGFLLLGGAGLALAPAARFDPNPLRLRDPDTESVSTYVQLLRSEGASPLTLALLRPSAREAREAADRAEQLESVRSARTLDDFVPARQGEKLPILARIRSVLGPAPADTSRPAATSTAEAMAAVDRVGTALSEFGPHATDAERRALRFTSLRIRQWSWLVSLWEGEDRGLFVRRLERNLLGPLPGAVADLRTGLARDTVTRSDLPAELVRRWVSEGGQHRVEVVPRGSLAEPEALERFVNDVRARFPDATGAPVVQHRAGEVAVRAFRTALLIALLGTLLVLLAALRSLRRAAQVALPLVVAALMTVGASVALGIPFNFANLIAIPLLLGVGVDNGIHMVHRHRITPGSTSLLRTSTARAVLVSFLTTILSFGNLAFSPHRGMASMGRLLAIGMAAVLATTLLLLPILLGRPGDADASAGGDSE